jgi:tetratricopeptide (TPR) repeat protein
MDKSETAKKLFFDGINCIQNNEYKEAEENFLNSLELVPDRYSVLDNLAVARMSLGKYVEARQSAQQSIKINPNNPVSWQNLGLVELAEGKIEKGNICFDEAIKLDPLFAQPLNNKAIALSLLNLDEQAIACCDQAIKIKNDFFEALNNKGDILKKMKRYSEAINTYELSIKIKKNSPAAYHKKADILFELKRYEEALALYDQAIAIDKDYVPALCNKSLILEKMERYAESLEICNNGITIDSSHPELWVNKSLILFKLKNFNESIEAANTALVIKENFSEAWNNKALSLVGLKNYEEAIICYDKAIELNPKSAEFLFNKANCLYFLKRYEDSITYSNKIIKLNPEFAKGYLAKGQVLSKLDKIDEAITSFNIGLKKDPDNKEGWNNLGLVYHQAGLLSKNNKNFSLAKQSFDQALKLKSDYYESYFNKSLTQLTIGEFKDGWKNYECRLKISKDNSEISRFSLLPPADSFEKIKGKTVIVWSEQGLGDSIQFCRFIPKLSKLCQKIIFEVPDKLTNLMSNQFNCEILKKGSAFVAKIDYQIAIASLPLLFNADINNISINNGAYLKTIKNKNDEWKKKLNLTNNKPNIGITFSGNPDYAGDEYRSTTLSSFLPLVGKANLFLLQKEIKQKDNDFLMQHPEIKFIGNDISDFEDLASVIENMDYVITTDTSIPHLSGAIGKKTYLLLSYIADWRWLTDVDYTPWYSSVVLVRKNNISDSWESLFKKIIKELKI